MNTKQKWNNFVELFLNFFRDKKTVKGARLTYEVTWNIVLLFIIILLIGGGFAAGIGAGYFASLVKDEPIRSYKTMKKEIYNYEETSELYFADNVYLGKLPTDLEREEVKIKDVSPFLINAVVATEDQYFYEHDGVVPKSIMRALFQEVANTSSQSGGSTLTQQLIKNQILTNEVSFERKAKEILLALRLEKFFDKPEILEAYLNVSTFGRNSSGRNIAGVQAAANGIFGVDVKKLTLPQAAFIAGLPQSPFGYTPFTQDGKVKKNLDPGLSRMKTVLKRMYDQEKITKKEYEKAINYNIAKDFISPKDSPIQKYPWLTYEIQKRSVEIIAEMLAKEDGYKKKDLDKDAILREQYTTLADRQIHQNGYEIHSTINKKIYDKMQTVAKNFPYYGTDKNQLVKDPASGKMITKAEQVETGAVLIENKTGKIISFVGGRNHKREATNHATSSTRPNGSTMKPLLVYAPSIELGTLSPGSVLPDVPLRLNPAASRPWPLNYDKQYHGLVTARYALTKSYNVPAVKAYTDILPQKPAAYLEKMGFTSLQEEDYTNRATALGALEKGVTVEENTNAFGTFANSGEFVDAYMIDKIMDKNGKVIYKHKADPVKVFSPQTAYLTLDMMRDVISQGTATSLRNRLKFQSDWAGKTGTGQNYDDSWFVATNPNVSFGVWIGYDTPKALDLTYKGISYGMRNIYLWADLMNAAYDADAKLVDPSERFQMPGGIVRRSICSVSGLLPSEGCSKAGLVTTDLFKSGSVPNKTDDSLTNGKIVQIGEKKYMALDSTPSEFAYSGLMLNPDYIEKLFGITVSDPSNLVQNNPKWDKVAIPTDKISDNGKTPVALKIVQKGDGVSWSPHSENDIVGYRVYKEGKKVASIKSGESLEFKGGNGSYTVNAVDIAGRESSSSNVVTIGQKKEEPKKEDKSSETDKEKEQGKDKEKNTANKDKKEETTSEDSGQNKPEDNKQEDSQNQPSENNSEENTP
ncbi:transglycosylase domain-containing protein [Niallia sp. 03133]|uniref:transglycosylase domain-containing protein n=1 Tax=Niallia sp. 03133 TaxID=3458060 RepID=UPI0040442A0C